MPYIVSQGGGRYITGGTTFTGHYFYDYTASAVNFSTKARRNRLLAWVSIYYESDTQDVSVSLGTTPGGKELIEDVVIPPYEETTIMVNYFSRSDWEMYWQGLKIGAKVTFYLM